MCVNRTKIFSPLSFFFFFWDTFYKFMSFQTSSVARWKCPESQVEFHQNKDWIIQKVSCLKPNPGSCFTANWANNESWVMCKKRLVVKLFRYSLTGLTPFKISTWWLNASTKQMSLSGVNRARLFHALARCVKSLHLPTIHSTSQCITDGGIFLCEVH